MTAHNQAENKYVIFGLFGPPYKVTSLEPEKHLILNCNKEKYCLFCIKLPCLKINFDKYTCSLEYKTIATTMSRIKINKWVKREKLTRGGISTIRYMTLQAVIGSYRVAEKKDCPFKTATLLPHWKSAEPRVAAHFVVEDKEEKIFKDCKMVEKFVGTWKMISSDNFDDYMKAIGKNVCGWS